MFGRWPNEDHHGNDERSGTNLQPIHTFLHYKTGRPTIAKSRPVISLNPGESVVSEAD